MTNIISLNVPTKIIFGPGAYSRIPTVIQRLGAKKALLLSDRPIRTELETELTSKGIKVLTFSRFRGEPDIDIVNECLKFSEGFNPDICIGLGGGSVLDTAKLIGWIKGNGCIEVKDFMDINFSKRGIPMIMIPTTSGTGSEATPNAIFLNKQGKKQAVISRHMIPDTAIVDPKLMFTLPPKLTALTGIDALSHCVESFLSKNGSIWSDELALKGVKLVYKSLYAAIDDGYALEARQDMSLASFLGGISLTNAGTCGIHALAYPLAKYGLSHSQGVAIIYPYVMSFFDYLKVEKIRTLKKMLGINEMEDLINPIIDSLRKVNVPYKLKDVNIGKNDIEKISQEAIKQERLLKNNPITLSKEDIKTIYINAFIGDLF